MIIVLLGPTASGKSSLALSLAPIVDGEIVNGDAFQVYKGLEKATMAPSENDKKLVPHHLYSFLEVEDSYNIARYQQDCRKAIEEIRNRGKTPIIVGGSGLYIRAALYDYDLSVDTSSVDLAPYERLSDEALHAALRELDPLEAEKIPFKNRRRVMRSIALSIAYGAPKSSMISEKGPAKAYDDIVFLAIDADREQLNERIDQRIDEMVDDGMVEEVLALLSGRDLNLPSFKAIGVKELIPYMKGETSLDSAIEEIRKNTKRYVKRQLTFIRHQFDAAKVKDINGCLEAIGWKNGI